MLENNSKPGEKITREQLQAQRRNYQRTTPSSAKEVTKNNSNPGEEITREQIQAPRRRLPQNNSNPGEETENSSKPDEKNYSNPAKEVRKQLQIRQRNHHRTVPNLQRSQELHLQPGENYQRTAPNSAKKLINKTELGRFLSIKLSRTTPNPVKRIIREQFQNS